MKIERVSEKELHRRTGMSDILGYTFPEKETILLKEGMSRTQEKEVLAHEQDHYKNGEEGPFWTAVAGAAINYLGSKKQADAADDAAAQQSEAARLAAEQAAFNPYDTFGAFGQAQFDKDTGQARLIANPEMANLQNLYQQQATQFAGQGQTALGQQAGALGEQFLGGIQADPFAAAETQFGRMEEILNPARQRQRESLEGRLLKQGRLGSTGGTLQQQGLETAIDQSSSQNLVNALQQSQAMTAQQAGLGQQLGMFGQQQQDVGFNQSQARLGALGNIDQQLMQYANLGSNLGGRQSAAGAQQGAFNMQGATAGTSALLGGAAGQAQAYNQLGSAFGDYFNQPTGQVTATEMLQSPEQDFYA